MLSLVLENTHVLGKLKILIINMIYFITIYFFFLISRFFGINVTKPILHKLILKYNISKIENKVIIGPLTLSPRSALIGSKDNKGSLRFIFHIFHNFHLHVIVQL